jgi:hypothetical protein
MASITSINQETDEIENRCGAGALHQFSNWATVAVDLNRLSGFASFCMDAHHPAVLTLPPAACKLLCETLARWPLSAKYRKISKA